MVEIIVATITGIFGILGIAYGKFKFNSLKDLNQQQSEEIKFRSRALSVDLGEWGLINSDIQSVLNETSIDRFFLLNAFNGFHDPRWTTGLYQVQKDNANLVSYIHFGIDAHYVSLLKKVRSEGTVEVLVDEIPESIIKAVYQTEGVLTSQWYYLLDTSLDTGAVSITYCSFSSRTATELTQAELDKCAVLVGKLKGALT